MAGKRSIHDDDLHLHDDEDLLDHDDGAGGFSKQTWAYIIAALVVLAVIGGTLVYFNVGEGTISGVTLTPPSVAEDLFTFAYSVNTDRGSASGDGLFTVHHDAEIVHTRTISVVGGGGRIDLEAEQFVVGNGEYEFRFNFKGFEAKSNYTIGIPDRTNFIVTSIRVDSFLAYPFGASEAALQLNINFFSYAPDLIYAAAPFNSSIHVVVTKNGVQAIAPLDQRVDGLLTKSLNITPTLGPGNYSVNVTFNNQWVKPDSSIKTLWHDNRTYLHDKPTACVSPTFYRATPANSYTITTDGSCSTDDLGIAQYAWYYGTGDEISNGTSPFETFTYSDHTPRTYTCTLRVQDTGIPGVADSRQDDTVEFQVQVAFS